MNWIKTCKRVISLSALIIITAFFALAAVNFIEQLATPTAVAQDGVSTGMSTSTRDVILRTLHITPSKSSPGTNAFIVRSKAGTEWVSVSPTNAQLQYQVAGTLYTGVTGLFILTNNGTLQTTRTNLTFKNGLLVDGP